MPWPGSTARRSAVTLDVDGLAPGVHVLTPSVNLPASLKLIGLSPATVTVTIALPHRPRPARPPARPRRRGHSGPPVRHGRHPGGRQRRPQADPGLRPRPGHRPRAARAGWRARRRPGHPPVGRHVRPAIAAGAASLGADVQLAGTLPTPALAFIAGSGEFGAGIMVSASHNPADDNGLKVLDARGMKLDDDREDALEALIWRAEELVGPRNAGVGRVSTSAELLERYRAHRLALAGTVGTSLRIVLDCANGSGGVSAPGVLAATGATVEVIHNEPDGVNINVDCGATAPAALARTVVERRADLGFALDGDADRLVVVDRHGQVVDGDQLIGLHRPRPAPPRGPPPRHRGRDRPVQRRARGRPRRGRRAGRPDAGRRQVHPRGDAGQRRQPGRREERPRDRPRPQLIGRWPGHRPRAARRPGPVRPAGGRAGRRNSPLPAGATSRPRSSQGPVGGRSGPPSRHRRGRAAARTRRPGPRPAVGHRARPASHGRGTGRGARGASWPTRSRPSPGSVYTSPAPAPVETGAHHRDGERPTCAESSATPVRARPARS